MNLKNKYIVLEFPEIWIKLLPEDGLFFISLLRWLSNVDHDRTVQRKKARVYISFSCWKSPGMHFTHQAFLSQQNVFTNEHALSCKSGHSAEVCGPKTKGFIAKSFTKNDRRGDFHFKTRRLWNGDMQLYGCSVVYLGRVIFVNFKFRLLLSALYNQRDCPLFTLFTYVYFIPSGRELNSDVYWIQ